MTPTFSILHATYGRPAQAVAMMKLWHARSRDRERIEYLFAVNDDDPTKQELMERIGDEDVLFSRVLLVQGDFIGSASAWNQAAMMHSTGALLIQAQDDVEPPEDWSTRLLETLWVNAGVARWQDQSIVVAVSDGYRQDKLLCTAIVTRKRMEQAGCFLCPEYISVFSDDEHTYRALRDARDGKVKLINARNLVFRHHHHYHNKAVPFDATYARENSAKAYGVGSNLFYQRNPEALTDGIVTWR